MAFDGAITSPIPALPTASGPRGRASTAPAQAAPSRRRLGTDRLPFVGQLDDGQKSYWLMTPLAEGETEALRARTYAAWFLVYAELNGAEAARRLMDRIERDMPSRYPVVDRAFLREVSGRY